MRIITEKGKLFGLINIIDLGVIIGFSVVLLFGGFKVFGKSAPSNKQNFPTKKIIFRIKATREDNSITRKFTTGETLMAQTGKLDAKIIKASFSPAKVETTDANGKIHFVENPLYKDILIDVEAYVSKTKATNKLGEQEIICGNIFHLKTMKTYVKGIIIKIY